MNARRLKLTKHATLELVLAKSSVCTRTLMT